MAAKTFLTNIPTGLKYNWNTSGNWNPSGSPTNGDDVTMASGGSNQATYTALDDILNLTLNNMTIADNGVTLELTHQSRALVAHDAEEAAAMVATWNAERVRAA
jgi:hypothetical protein